MILRAFDELLALLKHFDHYLKIFSIQLKLFCYVLYSGKSVILFEINIEL